MIGTADEIVYFGQSWKLRQRSFESLGRYYHRAPDISLPWSLALAHCPAEEMHERGSKAIRAFAPKFSTSIPSTPANRGRMPEIIRHARVFQDQINSNGAFNLANLQSRMERALANPAPPWRRGKQRKKTGKRAPKPEPVTSDPPVHLTGDELREALQHHGVPLNDTLKINLCDDGSVVTKHGEVIGSWSMDQYTNV